MLRASAGAPGAPREPTHSPARGSLPPAGVVPKCGSLLSLSLKHVALKIGVGTCRRVLPKRAARTKGNFFKKKDKSVLLGLA